MLWPMPSLNVDKMPPAGRARREWLQDQLGKHTNTDTGQPWNQRDVAAKAGCSQGLASRVLEGKRTTGAKTTQIQRIVAKVLDTPVGTLFGIICTNCTNCGAEHPPRRALASK